MLVIKYKLEKQIKTISFGDTINVDIHRVGGRQEVNLVVNWARWGKGGRGLEEGDKYGEEGLDDGKKVFGMVDRVKGQVWVVRSSGKGPRGHGFRCII